MGGFVGVEDAEVVKGGGGAGGLGAEVWWEGGGSWCLNGVVFLGDGCRGGGGERIHAQTYQHLHIRFQSTHHSAEVPYQDIDFQSVQESSWILKFEISLP